MAWLGHPLVGDATYGGKAQWGLSRQALHAHRLVLRHPITAQVLRLESPLPSELVQAVQQAGLHYNLDKLWQVEPA
jgi:23S rRNA pseudouridine1911/1915/1917 synthase